MSFAHADFHTNDSLSLAYSSVRDEFSFEAIVQILKGKVLFL